MATVQSHSINEDNNLITTRELPLYKTNTPDEPILIQDEITGFSDTLDGLSIGLDDSGNAVINNKENKNIVFSTNNTEKMKLDNNGTLEILGANNNHPLKLSRTTENNVYMKFSNSAAVAGTEIGVESGGSTLIRARDNASMNFHTNNAQRMNISGAGNVGIGINAGPSDKLTVAGDIKANSINLSNSIIKLGSDLGTAGQVMKMNSGATALEWGTISGGSSLWSESNTGNKIYYSLDNVGIGTDNPTKKFEVDGTCRIHDTLFLGDENGPAMIRMGGGAAGDEYSLYSIIETWNYNSTEDTEMLLFKGNDSPADRIRLKAATIVFDTYTGSAGSEAERRAESIRMTIKNDGKVGINTESPTKTLEVNGSGLFGSTVGNYGDPTRQLNIVGSDAVMRIARTGINDPAVELLHLSTDGDTRNSYWDFMCNENVFRIRDRLNNKYITIKEETVYTGIDVDNPQYQLDVGGEINASGDVNSAGTALTSDSRIKKNITDSNIDDIYNKFKNIKIKQYKYTDNYLTYTGKEDKEVSGVLAQEIKEVFPDIVRTKDWKLRYKTKEAVFDSDGNKIEPEEYYEKEYTDFHRIDMNKLIIKMSATIISGQKKIEELESTVQDLESSNEILSADNNHLNQRCSQIEKVVDALIEQLLELNVISEE